jgi:ABC-type sugar transport system ATPase subunit
MTTIHLHAVTKTYPGGHAGVRGIDLEIEAGEFLVLVGPSGCGKSTLLRLIAGLETPEAGQIHIGGVDVTREPPQSRDLAMVFQSYALYPHMTVRQNMAYGLAVRGTARDTIDTRVREAAAALQLETLLDRRPSQLSGGQRQRVALGRALVRRPKAFLLDEPLSNLDPSLRAHARAELRRLHQTIRTTVVYVTHDQEEAMTLGGRVAVMRAGGLEQVGAPATVYAHPRNTFVAQFIGAPAMNLIPAAVLGLDAPAGTMAGIRPHRVRIDPGGTLEAVVDLVEPRGHDALVHLRPAGPDAPPILAVVTTDPPSPGTAVRLVLPREHVELFDERGQATRGAAIAPGSGLEPL